MDTDFHSIKLSNRLNKDNIFVKKKSIHVMNGAFVGGYSIITKGVTIGKNSIVSNGSVVFNDIPENVIVQGNPASILKRIEMGHE